MMVEFNSFNPKTNEEVAIWIDVTKIIWLSPAKIPGKVSDRKGIPFAREGTAINMGAGGIVVVAGTLIEVLEKIPEDDPIIVVEPPEIQR